jgi:hypothetical protein
MMFLMQCRAFIHCFYRRRGIAWFFIGSIMILLISCSSAEAPAEHSLSSASPSSQATRPAIAPGTVLYQADWSHGLDGWQTAPGWQLHDGFLQTNGAAKLVITAPYHIPVSDYAVEARIQIMSVAPAGGYLGIKAEKAPGRDGYVANVLNLLKAGNYPNGLHPQAQVYLDPMKSMERGTFETIDYDPKLQWHTYRVEIRGAWVRFFIDNVAISDATSISTDHLSNGPIAIDGSLAVLRVSSFSISAL